MYYCLDVHVRNMLVRGTIRIWQDKIEDSFWKTYAFSIFQKLPFSFLLEVGTRTIPVIHPGQILHLPSWPVLWLFKRSPNEQYTRYIRNICVVTPAWRTAIPVCSNGFDCCPPESYCPRKSLICSLVCRGNKCFNQDQRSLQAQVQLRCGDIDSISVCLPSLHLHLGQQKCNTIIGKQNKFEKTTFGNI